MSDSCKEFEAWLMSQIKGRPLLSEAWEAGQQAARRAALEEAAHYLEGLNAAAKGQHNYYHFAANGVRALAVQVVQEDKSCA